MPNLPDVLPESGKFSKLFRWLNQLRSYVDSLKPVQTPNMRIHHSAVGVSHEPTVKPETTSTGDDSHWI